MPMSSTQGLRVLFVEDDDIDQLAFRRVVEQHKLGYLYKVASTLSEALDWLQTESFDIVLADYHLGSDSAFALLEVVGNIPLIILTGQGDETLAVEAMKAGASDYIVKDSQHSHLKVIGFAVENAVNRRLAEDNARELERERLRRETLEEFLRDTSHDLRTPLAMLSISIDLMERYAANVVALVEAPQVRIPEVRAQAVKIQDRAHVLQVNRQHLERLITQMLDMMKWDRTPSSLQHVCSAASLIAECILIYETKAKLKNQSITFVQEIDDAKFMGDKVSFITALGNLLDNAIQYSDGGGDIRVTLAATPTDVRISVHDDGIGFPIEETENIFKRFYRLDKARRTFTGGSGLGLSIVRRVVELYGGHIDVESAVGQGSTFTIILPRLLAAAT